MNPEKEEICQNLSKRMLKVLFQDNKLASSITFYSVKAVTSVPELRGRNSVAN